MDCCFPKSFPAATMMIPVFPAASSDEPPQRTHPIGMSAYYTLGACIGHGSFSKVYIGLHTLTGEHVAAKRIMLRNNPTVQREFDLMTKLAHPHVVGVRDFDLLEDRAYIYMEYMPGGSVSGMLASFKFRLHEGLIRRYVRQALLGLAYLHSQGVVHRDIKPANMLVTLDGTLKLSDFGTCKTISEKSSSTMKIVGTPSYMSPEAIRGKTSFGSDVWALGASLVEMASGHAPWSELGLSDPIALLFHIGMVPQGDGTEHHPEVPEHLSAEAKGFLKMCFVVDSKKRATCEQLLVHPFLSGDVPSPDGIEEIDSYLLTRESSNKSMISTLSSQVTQLLPFTNEEPSPQTLHERYGDVHVLPVPTGPVPEEDTDSGSEEDDYTEDGRTSTGRKYFLEKRDPSSITTHINAATFTESKPPDPQSYSIPDESRSLTSTKQKFAPPKRVTESKQGV